MKKRFLALFLSLVLTTAPSLSAFADEPVAESPAQEISLPEDKAGDALQVPEIGDQIASILESGEDESENGDAYYDEDKDDEGDWFDKDDDDEYEDDSDEEDEDEDDFESESDFEYAFNDDGTVRITKYTGSNDSEDVFIPETIDGHAVTVIGAHAFAESAPNSVYMPSTLREIREYAFYNSYVINVYLNDGLTYIGEHAFEFCYFLSELIIPDTVSFIGDDAIDYDTVYNLTVTGPKQFTYTTKADNTILITGSPLQNYAQHMVIPAYINGRKVTEIDEAAFYAFDVLEDVTIPHTVTKIGAGAFMECRDLEEVNLSAGLVTIDELAFLNCYDLDYVYVPGTVKTIGDFAFAVFYDFDYDEAYLNWDFGLGGISGSAAEKYADEYGLDFYPFKCNHSYGRIVVGVQNASCGYNGYTGDTCCKECGAVITEGSKIPATGDHHFIDNICQICGKPEKLGTPVIKSVTNGLKSVVVQWEAVEGADNYRIYRRKEDVTSWSYVGDSRTLRFDDTTAASGTTYYYTVRCYDLDVMKPQGGYDKTGKGVFCLKAGTPSSLTNTASDITVKWAKITGAEGYYVYRKSGSDSYKRIGEVKGGSNVSYTDTTVKDNNGTAYTYTIRAYHGKTLGNYAGKTLTRLTGVTLSTLSNPSTKAMKVTWKKQSKVSGYEIQYSTSSTFASGNKSVKVSGAGTLSKTIKSLTKGKTYYVRIRGYKTVGTRTDYSAWSAKKSIKIKK